MGLKQILQVVRAKGLSFWIILIIGIWFLSSDIMHHRYMNDEPPNRGVIGHDIRGYYGYLPAVFIYGDYRLDFIGKKGFKNENRFLCLTLEDGQRLIQYTSGLSILYAPFFLTAHALAPALGETRDGYNWVYQFFLVMSALFYVLIGLVFLRKLLLKYFNDLIAGVVLILVTLGTNLFYYTVYEGPMSHSYSFTLIAIFLYLVDRWYARTTILNTVLLGFIFGMIVLVRPTNVMVVLILILWRIDSWAALQSRIGFLIQKTPLILLMILFFLIPWIPQLLYWKSITGQFFYNSYDKVGSAFYFNAPQTHKMLFSYRKGWFVYTPMMFVAFTGFILLYKKRKDLFFSTIVYMVVMIYLLSSWWAWWFGGGFGSRSMIDTYAVMAFPLAAVIDWLQKHRIGYIRIIGIVVITLLLALQLMQTKQYTKNSIHYVAMDKDAYWHNYFKIKKRGIWHLLSEPDHRLARLGIYYYYDWSADYDAFREIPREKAMQQIREEITEDKKTMRSIHRHAKRHDISAQETIQMVVERIYDQKTSRKNL